MSVVGFIVFRILIPALGLAGALYVCTALFRPDVMVRHLASPQRGPYQSFTKAEWARGILTFLAVAVFVYYVTYVFVLLIPPDWGTTDEDGDWTDLRSQGRGVLTLFGSLLLIDVLEKIARERMALLGERSVLAALSGALRHEPPDTLKRIEERFEENVEGAMRQYGAAEQAAIGTARAEAVRRMHGR